MYFFNPYTICSHSIRKKVNVLFIATSKNEFLARFLELTFNFSDMSVSDRAHLVDHRAYLHTRQYLFEYLFHSDDRDVKFTSHEYKRIQRSQQYLIEKVLPDRPEGAVLLTQPSKDEHVDVFDFKNAWLNYDEALDQIDSWKCEGFKFHETSCGYSCFKLKDGTMGMLFNLTSDDAKYAKETPLNLMFELPRQLSLPVACFDLAFCEVVARELGPPGMAEMMIACRVSQ